jgi:hypothetical protein
VSRRAAAVLAALALASAGSPSGATPGERLVVDGETVVLHGDERFEAVEVKNGGVLAVTPLDGTAGTGRLSLAARSIRVDATSRISADGAGFRGVLDGRGEGPGGGEGGETELSRLLAPRHFVGSGAGGAHGGRGGDGIFEEERGRWKGGAPYGAADGEEVGLGSAGGAPPVAHHSQRIRGGNGGGAIVLVTDELVIEGRVSADGEPGPAAEFDAAGGGAGGGIVLRAERLRLTGTVSARGGPGGPGVEVGGSGGGGRVKVFYRDGALDTGLLDVAPGRGPCPGERASPWGCEGSVYVERLPPRLYLPSLQQRGCVREPRHALVIVVDTSTSMLAPLPGGWQRSEAAYAAAVALVGNLHPGDRHALVRFAGRAEIVQELSPEPPLSLARLRALPIEAGSSIDRGLVAARAALDAARPGEAKRVVLLTDGVLDAAEASAVIPAARELSELGALLFALGLGPEADAKLLAAVTGDPARAFVAPEGSSQALQLAVAGSRARCPVD